ncbi:MAG: hypothetical protein AAFU03_01960 [Bacteroidota bacterium]
MPYQRLARFLAIVLLFVLIYLQASIRPLEWVITLAYTITVPILAAFLLDCYFLIRDFRRGDLFLIRNLTLLVVAFTIIAIPVYLIQGLVIGRSMAPSSWIILSLALYLSVQSLFHVRLDNVSLRLKTGFVPSLELPLFSFRSVQVGEDFIDLKLENGQQRRLRRSYFFPKDWKRLQERLSKLAF